MGNALNLDLSTIVYNFGNQTIAGAKTFSTTIKLSSVTASKLIATDASSNLIVASGTYAISISGTAATATLATTATTATNAQNILTTPVNTNANYYLVYVASNSSSNQAPDAYGGFSYNPTVAGIALINSSTAPASPTIITQLNLATSTQNSSRIVFSGQEFNNAGHTSTDGLGFLLGHNRANDKQLWITDSSLSGSNTTNPVLRFLISGTGTAVQIDSTATNGTSILPVQFGNAGAVTTIAGSSVNLPSLTASSFVFTDSSKNLTSSSSAILTQANGGTNASSYTVSGVIFQNSGGTAFSSGAGLTFTSTAASPILNILTATTGSSNSATLNLTRGDTANGASQIQLLTGASSIWACGMFSTATAFTSNANDLVFRAGTGAGGVGNVLFLGQSTGDVTANLGNLIINTVNKGLQIKGAAVSAGTSNAAFSTSVTLVGGTVTVNNSFVTAACSGSMAVATAGGTPGTGYRLNVGSGTFTVTSSSALDTSTLNVFFVKGI